MNASPPVVREARVLGHVVAEFDKRQAVVAPVGALLAGMLQILPIAFFAQLVLLRPDLNARRPLWKFGALFASEHNFGPIH